MKDREGINRPPLDEKTSSRAVHYPKNLDNRPPGLVNLPRSETFDGSRPPSLAGSDDDEDDESDYDWSAEEDLAEEEAKFEWKMGVKGDRKSWGVKKTITFLFSSLIGSTFLATLLVAASLILHYFWYKKDPTAHRRYVTYNVEAWFWWTAANLVFSWCLAMLIDLVPAVALLVISIGWGHISERVKNSIEIYNSVKGTIKPTFYAASGWVSWVIIFESIYKLYDGTNENLSYASYTPRVYQVVRFLFFFALVISLQRVVSHAMAVSFHRTAFKERLQDVSEALQAIEKLRNYKAPKGHHAKKSSGARTPTFGFSLPSYADKNKYNFVPRSQDVTCSPDLDKDGGQADTEDGVAKNKGKRKSGFQQVLTHVHSDNTNSQSPSATPEKSGAHPPDQSRSVEDHEYDATAMMAQAAKAFKTAVLHDARNITGKDNNSLGWNVSSASEAKRLARSIYYTFVDRRRRYLIPSDFHPAFASPEEAEKAFRVFDDDNNGDISRRELKSALVKVYKERRLLSRSIRDVGVALKMLDRILLLIAMIVLFFISLSVFGINVTQSLTSVYTLGLAASFVFRSSASNAFDAIMFLFVTHPFDTGDRCFIGTENLVVKKMGLFATVFQRADGTETYYFNSQLFNLFITNARRSAKTFENLTMQVAWDTPLEKLDALIAAINEWMETEENRWFQPSTSLVIQRIDFQRFMECTIVIGHNGNWQDWNLRLIRKTAFHAAVQFYCRQLGIVCYQSPIPVTYGDQQGSLRQHDDRSEISRPSDTEDSGPGLPAQATRDKSDLLGFKPPSSTTTLRARKSKSRRAIMASNLGDV